MSMFRRPGEESSSSSEASYENTEDDETSASHQDSVLSRIQTLDSAASTQSGQRPVPPRLEMRQNSTQNVRDLMLHALLEEKAIAAAAQRLGKDISDPEVQKMGHEAYQEIARQISNNVDDTYAGEEMRNHRATAQEGITKLTRNNLSRLTAVPEGAALSQALVARPLNALSTELPQQPSTGFDILSGIHAPAELQLRGYPGLQTDRYAREFSELEIVGKGGYGKVYKAKHKLDGSFYAVKRIPVSPAKLAKIQEHGSEELESMLQEVRSLARFDHTNVVRYHNAWLEFTTAPIVQSNLPGGTLLRPSRLLENVVASSTSPSAPNDLQIEFEELSFGDPFDRPDNNYGAGIVFETSDNGVGADTSISESDNLSYKAQLRKSARRGMRRGSQASQATIATISSSKSHMSVVEDVDEEEEDVETIPRSHMSYYPPGASEMTESMVTHSDVPGHLVPVRDTGPVLTLNVQMSLCETNLSALLSADRTNPASLIVDRHCFHPCLSLELLWNIISGVEYLHAQGVVHRDLKPANIFLSLSKARYPPYGSVDVSSCKLCPKRDCLHITPRIGDFGLVAALDDSCLDVGTMSKPVGTEFYRPEASSKISEKLDVYALGVIGFEMLQEFGTRMERVAALADFRRGIFPDNFASNIGYAGAEVQSLLSNMVHADERQRLNCEEVKRDMGRIVHSLKT
jgi:translation initiation factor 2-alpha kinase 3